MTNCGLMIALERSYLRQSRPRQSSIWVHLERFRFRAHLGRLQLTQELVEDLCHVADDRHVDLHALGNR
jgi:hypothetical protein